MKFIAFQNENLGIVKDKISNFSILHITSKVVDTFI